LALSLSYCSSSNAVLGTSDCSTDGTTNFVTGTSCAEDPNTHANQFANILNAVIRRYRDEVHLAKLNFQKVWIDNSYSWDIRISEWNALLNSLK